MAYRRPTAPTARSDNLENLVRQVVNHPSYQDAVSTSQRVNETTSSSSNEPHNGSGEPSVSSVEGSATSVQTGLDVASSSNQNYQNSARRTPREEFQALIHRGASFQQSPNLPQFQRRTSWGPLPSSRSQSGSQGKLKPYINTSSCKGKNPNKKTTFAGEVALLRRPSDSMVRGGAKAELQRLGHVVSSFEFDKLWSANEVQEKLQDAFKKPPLESIDGVLDNQSK